MLLQSQVTEFLGAGNSFCAALPFSVKCFALLWLLCCGLQVTEFLGAGARQFGFMVRGLRELQPKLEALNIPFFLLKGRSTLDSLLLEKLLLLMAVQQHKLEALNIPFLPADRRVAAFRRLGYVGSCTVAGRHLQHLAGGGWHRPATSSMRHALDADSIDSTN